MIGTMNRMIVIGGIAGALVAASPAAATGDNARAVEREARGDTSRKVEARLFVVDDRGKLEVIQTDGVVRVKLDGKELPEDRMQRSENRIIVLGEDGERLHAVRLAPEGGLQLFGGRPVPRPGARDRQYVGVFAAHRAHLGVTLGQIDPAMASHLGIDPEEVVLIADVRPDGPAGKAGLQRFDIVVEFNGTSPVTQAAIREQVLASEPGDTLTLGVLRAGARKDIEVTLEARAMPSSPDAMAREAEDLAQWLFRRNGPPRDIGQWQRWREFLPDDARRELILRRFDLDSIDEIRDELLQSLQELSRVDLDSDKIQEQVRQLSDQAVAELIRRIDGGDYARLADELLRSSRGRAVAPRVEFFREDGGKGVIVHPPAPGAELRDIARAAPDRHAPRADRVLDERISQLEQRLERIESMLRQLVEEKQR